jgi:hypothetical protein
MQVDSGINAGGLFAVLFIILKLAGVITVSWWWLLLPALVIIGLCVAVVLGLIGIYAIAHFIDTEGRD